LKILSGAATVSGSGRDEFEILPPPDNQETAVKKDSAEVKKEKSYSFLIKIKVLLWLTDLDRSFFNI
jgi:hypothetical protein